MHRDAIIIRARLIDNILFWIIAPITVIILILIVMATPLADWQHWDVWKMILGIMVPSTMLIFGFWAQYVRIDGDVLTYSNRLSFIRNKRMQISRITKMNIQSGDSRIKTKGYFLLCVYDEDEYSKYPLAIDMLSFNKKTRAIIVNTIRDRNPRIIVDESVETIAVGNDPNVSISWSALSWNRGKRNRDEKV